MRNISAILALFLSVALSAQSEPLLRFPALSPDGSQLAFSYQGDIWTVEADGGVARRLTIHESYERFPQWSPDGTKIAFQGNRYGNDDVFVIDASGGMPLRITHHSSGDNTPQWTNDGHLMFASSRLFREVERSAEIFTVPATGGTPQRVMDAFGVRPVPSADGRYIAYVERNCRFAREAYTGPANRSIYVYDKQNNAYTAVADTDAQESNPAWDNQGNLYYLSAANGRYNIYRQKVGGTAEALTKFKDEGIREFTVSADGSRIVFERANGLFLMASDGRSKVQRLDIEVTADYRFDPIEQKTLSRSATEMAVSPNGDHLLFGVRGELFLKVNDKEKGTSIQLTDHPYRDQNGRWLNDSTIVFLSDRDGNRELYMLQSSDPDQSDLYRSLKHQTRRLTQTEAEEGSFVLSPDRSQVAMLRGRGQLIIADISESGLSNEKVMLDGWATARGVRWSPDGRYLAYSLSDLDFNSEIYIHPVDQSREPVNVSMHPRGDYGPFWSADGSKLGFMSIRNNGDSDIWFAWLKESDWQNTKQDWEWDEGEDTEEETDSLTQIDFVNIHQRLEQVTRMPGNEDDLVISDDGETFFFTTNNGGRNGSPGGSALMSIKWDGSESKTMAAKVRISRMALGPKGKQIYVLKSGGTIASIKTDGKKLEGQSFSARMNVNHYEERKQVFDEAWRTLRDGFYDPQFHGQDWDDLRAYYEPLCMAASTEQDFRDMFNTMLGQLNASHMGLYGSNPEETQSDRTGQLGAEVSAVAGGVRIERIIPNSPADRERSQLAVGEVITAVNGSAIQSNSSYYGLLNGTVDQRTLLTVRGTDGASREVVIRPTGSLRSELYEAWVAERKRLTDEYSGGRLGYIHIQGMNWPSFERFERELTASGLGKDGIVIDVRYNGGGWTTDMLMTVLNVRQHAYTVPRGAESKLEGNHPKYANNYPYGERLPQAALTKPSIALCNQTSYSNAEIFSHAYKTLGHGTLVGMPTFGAVISTGGMGLINGNFVRMPYRAWYVKATGDNMETTPAVPDIELENSPNSKAEGRDEQLQKAVDTLLEQIDN
ncbi:MAG: S41 family peptidase [Bacteroidota bacterium]